MLFGKKTIATLPVGSGLFLTQLSLADTADELDKVIISAKAAVDATQFAGSVTVITEDDIHASGATTVTEILETAPGIQLVVSGRNSGKTPQLRGQDTDQVLVLVNGKRLPNTDRNLPFSPAFRYNWVPIANIKRIEVIRGPASSLYGTDALAGVVNIITRKAEKEWGGQFTLYGKQTDSANGGDGEGISLATSGALTTNTDLALAIESTQIDAIFDDNNELTLQSEKQTENLQADFGINIDEDSRLQLGLLYGEEEGEDIDNGRFGVTIIPLEVRRRLGVVDYQTKLGAFATNFSLLTSTADVREGSAMLWEIGEDGAAIDVQGQLSPQHYFSGGISYREEEAIRTDSVIFDDSINATTVLIHDVVDINDHNKLTLGFAYDNHSKYDNESSPKINWFSQLSPSWGFKAGYGESYLAPSLREGSSAYVVLAGPRRTYIGNDDLQPETAKTVELGLTYKSNKLVGSLTLFRTEVDDLIALKDTVDNSGPFPVITAEYNNLEEALIQGIELEWSLFSNNNHTQTRFSYTYLDAENRAQDNHGNALPDRADHSIKVNVTHQLPKQGLTVNAGVHYLSDQYTNLANTEKVSSYSVADISISKVLWGNLDMRFGIDNVGNKTVLDGDALELLEVGRSYQLTLSASF